MKSLNIYDYSVVVIYMVMMVGIGIYFMRFIKGDSDYFKAGNKLTWWIAGLSAFMSGFSAYMFTAGAGLVYQEGLTGALILFLTGVAIFFGYLIFAKLWRRTRVTTILEFMAQRFNLPSHQIASLIYTPISTLYCGVALYALSIFISTALNLDIFLVIWICGLVIVAYTLLGGIWAVSVTDTVQFLVLMPVCLLMIPLSLAKLDNLSDLINSTPSGFYKIGSENHPWYWILALLLLLIHGQNTNPIVQRYFSVRDEAEARKVSLMCSLLFIVGIATWAVPPMVARVIYPDLGAVIDLPNPHEGAYVVMALNILPHGLIGVMIAAIFAAAMSAIDSQYNVLSGVITKDICQRWIKAELKPKTLLRIGQISTLAVGLLVIALSLSMAKTGEGSFAWMMKISSLTATPMATPLLLGFLYRRAPGWSFLVSFSCSGTAAMAFAFYPPLIKYVASFGPPVVFTAQTSIIFFVGFVAFLLSPYIFSSSDEEKKRIAEFFKLLSTPVNPAKEIESGDIDNNSIARFVGRMSITLGVMIALFVFIPGSAIDKLINLLVGISLGSLGGIFCFVGRKSRVKNLSISSA